MQLAAEDSESAMFGVKQNQPDVVHAPDAESVLDSDVQEVP